MASLYEFTFINSWTHVMPASYSGSEPRTSRPHRQIDRLDGHALSSIPHHLRNDAEELTSRTMSNFKKDEDADIAIMRVDRTSVFQEGELICYPTLIQQLMLSVQHDCSIPPRYNLEDAESFSPRLPSSSTLESDFLPTKQLPYSLESPNCFRTKMPAYGRWSILLSRRSHILLRILSWSQARL